VETQKIRVVETEINVDRAVRITSNCELLDAQGIQRDQTQLLDAALGVVPQHIVDSVYQARLVLNPAPLNTRGLKSKVLNGDVCVTKRRHNSRNSGACPLTDMDAHPSSRTRARVSSIIDAGKHN